MKRVLVIDDEEDLRFNLLEVLQFEAYEALGASNGPEGILMAQNYGPHLIICDIMMPGMDGFEVITELHRNPKTADIPFIFLSALTDQAITKRGLQLGAVSCLTKPFPLDMFLAIIKLHVGD